MTLLELINYAAENDISMDSELTVENDDGRKFIGYETSGAYQQKRVKLKDDKVIDYIVLQYEKPW